MSSSFHRLLALTPLVALSLAVCPCDLVSVPASQPSADAREVLRVAADPNDLPFSNAKAQGFENEIAELVARELGMRLEYRFLPQHLGFFREALKDGDADVVIGVPAGFERCLTTGAYYRSGYVLVTRRGDDRFTGFGDAGLKGKKLGVQITAGGGVPLAGELARAGLMGNLVGFPVFADESSGVSSGEDRGKSKLLRAVVEKKVDAALMWGPSAGYFVKGEKLPLEISPLEGVPASEGTVFDICVGVRRGKKDLRDRIDQILKTHAGEIDLILDAYDIPRVPTSMDARAKETRKP